MYAHMHTYNLQVHTVHNSSYIRRSALVSMSHHCLHIIFLIHRFVTQNYTFRPCWPSSDSFLVVYHTQVTASYATHWSKFSHYRVTYVHPMEPIYTSYIHAYIHTFSINEVLKCVGFPSRESVCIVSFVIMWRSTWRFSWQLLTRQQRKSVLE